MKHAGLHLAERALPDSGRFPFLDHEWIKPGSSHVCVPPFPRVGTHTWDDPQSEAKEVAPASFYLHLSGLATRSTSVARIRPTIKGAEIVWPVWLQTTHGVAPGNKRMAATTPANSAPRFMPSRSPRPFCRLRPDGILQSSATRRGVCQR